MNSNKYQMLPVLEKDIPAVFALLARLNPTGTASPTVTGETVDVPDNGTWSLAELVELHAKCNARTRAILSCVASASLADTEVSYSDLLEAGRPHANEPDGYGFNNLRADLAWIAKYAKKVKGANVWPLSFRQLGAEHPKGERILYKMPITIAQWWLETDQ